MDIFNITFGLAFLAGLASFLSPCVFSLVPAYVGYLGGRAAGGENTKGNRWVTFSHGLAFVLGFSVIFIFLGVAASAFGAGFGGSVWALVGEAGAGAFLDRWARGYAGAFPAQQGSFFLSQAGPATFGLAGPG